MKAKPILLFSLCIASTGLSRPAWLLDATTQFRVGFDTNPAAAGQATGAIIRDEDAALCTAGLTVVVGENAKPAGAPAWKLGYAIEDTRYEAWKSENSTTHRVTASLQGVAVGDWKIAADGSLYYIDGSLETLPSVAGCNAYGLALWRDRREQTQYRAKVAAVRDEARRVVRVAATLLNVDYHTRVRAGKVLFADRADYGLCLDWGTKVAPGSTWLVGARVGRQFQAKLPVAGGQYEYSNNYLKVGAGWEGKLGRRTTASLLAGPEFVDYTGNVNPAVFRGHRRTTLFLESSLTSKVTDKFSVTAKATRSLWLSSTGRSALVDVAAEVGASYAASATVTYRASAKVMQSNYLPSARDDWASAFGAGVTVKTSERVTVAVDVLTNNGWNEQSGTTGRSYARVFLSTGATVKF